jgi:hypothetical protein
VVVLLQLLKKAVEEMETVLILGLVQVQQEPQTQAVAEVEVVKVLQLTQQRSVEQAAPALLS